MVLSVLRVLIKALEYNAWLEYEWDTVLEFCQMILETARYDSLDISLLYSFNRKFA